ncbi:hypothetical protein [Candidatus Protochlamydia amoebophila]|nr:hypothetical protein [Candidatus Protochlamydia amoebophila]
MASMESYLFKYDFAQTSSLQDEYKKGAVHTNSFVKSFTEGREIVDLFGKTIHGFRVGSLSIYQNYKETG